MAFVFRSERNMMKSLNSQIEANNYSNEDEFNTDIISQIKSQESILKDPNIINNRYNNIFDPSPPFLTGAERNQLKKNDNSPGPGTYNISKGYYNKHRQFSSRQENSIPEEYELFDLPLLRMREVINNNPGPGHYNPSEKDLFGGRFKNKNKLLFNKDNNSSSNNSHKIWKKENNIQITNGNSLEIEKNINKLIYIYSSKRRKNEKENLKKEKKSEIAKKKVEEYSGGELPENFSMKNIRSPLTMKTSENNFGNNNNSKISGITLDTERTSINTSKLNNSQIRNKSSKLFQNLKSQLNNNNNQDQYLNNHLATEQSTNKNNTLFPILLKYDKSRIYKNEQNHDRLILFKSQNSNDFMNNMTEFDKLLNSEYFSNSPGPGYYDPIDSQHQKYFKPKNNCNYFNNFRGKKVTSLIKNKKTTPGPGYYKTDNDMINNKIVHNMNKKMRDVLFDVKKIAKLRLLRESEVSKRKENIKILKENYSFKPKNEDNNNSKEIFEEESLEYRKMHSPSVLLFNFGSNDKRFNDNKNIKKDYPGPGEYEAHLYKSIEEKNANITEAPSYKELYEKAENKNNLIERNSLNKDVINTPGVGEYNPNIITSIKYNYEHKNKMRPPIIHKSSFNPEMEMMTLLKVKEIKEKEKKLISYLGPGRYNNMLNKTFNDMNKNSDKNKPPFGSSEKKLEPKKMEIFPGPGQYDINSYYNWITRTYNILFS